LRVQPSDLLNILAQIDERGAGFRSLGDAWADTPTAHGRLILTEPAPRNLERSSRRVIRVKFANVCSP